MRNVGTRAEPLVLLGEPTIYLALPLVCAHWAIIRCRAEPPYLCSHGLISPGAVLVYRPKDPHELFICYSFFMPRTLPARRAMEQNAGLATTSLKAKTERQ